MISEGSCDTEDSIKWINYILSYIQIENLIFFPNFFIFSQISADLVSIRDFSKNKKRTIVCIKFKKKMQKAIAFSLVV